MADGVELMTQRMLELRFGSKLVRDLTDRDRDGKVDPEVIEEVIKEASDRVLGILLGGFSLDQVKNLTTSDYALRGMVCDVAIGIASRARPGILSTDGKTPLLSIGKMAERDLMDIASGKRRIAAEELKGRNRKLGVSVNLDPGSPVFAQRSDEPVGGGF